MDALIGPAALAFAERQSRVANALDRDLRLDCAALGVASHTVEILLCNMLAHAEFIPRRVAVLRAIGHSREKRLAHLRAIDAELAVADRAAQETIERFDFADRTAVPDAVRRAPKIVIEWYEAYPRNAADVRARLGLPPDRLRSGRQETARRLSPEAREADYLERLEPTARGAAIGRFAATMQRVFRDFKPHDDLVAKLVNSVTYESLSYKDISRHRNAFLKRQPTA